MIVGLSSTYREGLLAVEAVESLLDACRTVFVFEGPIGDAPESGLASPWETRIGQRVIVRYGQWASDAAKRSAMVASTRRFKSPVWGVVLDGDELLLHGENLGAILERADAEERVDGQEIVGLPLRLVELDGSCSIINARILRLDRVAEVITSSYHLRLTSGVEVAKVNVPLLAAGEPDSAEMVGGMQRRRPLAGEPHILHRAALRSPDRMVERQHVAEGHAFERMDVDRLGEVEAVPQEVGRIWVPS